MDDKSIIALFVKRDEEALAQVKMKYGRLYRSRFAGLLGNRSDEEESENDLLLALWRSIPPNDPDNLGAYIFAIAGRIAAGRMRAALQKKSAESRTVPLGEFEDAIPDAYTPENAWDSREIARAINDFLSQLDAQARVLFVRRYFFSEDVLSLARRFGLRENSVSVSLYRSKKKLKKLLMQRGIEL